MYVCVWLLAGLLGFSFMELSLDTMGPAEEFLARVDVEVDSPGPSSVIESIPLRARAGTARIHAPKDLQVCMYLQSMF